MTPEHACELIDRITYKPGWTFDATPEPRYQDTVSLTVSFTAPDTDVRYAPAYERTLPQTMTFYLHVAPCLTDLALWGLVLECVIHLELHEAREFFAVDERFSKPFHAHTSEGIVNWTCRSTVTTQRDHADITLLMPTLT